MNKEVAEQSPDEAASPPVAPRKPPFFTWLEARQRFKELLVVFFGVYAAFLLNRFETDRRDNIRRRQLYVALEHEVDETFNGLKNDLEEARKGIGEFDRRLAAGEMPPLSISYSHTVYSASDDATLLQAGGLELLDVATLDQLREVNRLQRAVVESLHTNFQLDLIILGGHENADFYDPATRQLRRQYAWYPVVLHNVLERAQELLAGEQRLLTMIRARQGSG